MSERYIDLFVRWNEVNAHVAEKLKNVAPAVERLKEVSSRVAGYVSSSMQEVASAFVAASPKMNTEYKKWADAADLQTVKFGSSTKQWQLLIDHFVEKYGISTEQAGDILRTVSEEMNTDTHKLARSTYRDLSTIYRFWDMLGPIVTGVQAKTDSAAFGIQGSSRKLTDAFDYTTTSVRLMKSFYDRLDLKIPFEDFVKTITTVTPKITAGIGEWTKVAAENRILGGKELLTWQQTVKNFAETFKIEPAAAEAIFHSIAKDMNIDIYDLSHNFKASGDFMARNWSHVQEILGKKVIPSLAPEEIKTRAAETVKVLAATPAAVKGPTGAELPGYAEQQRKFAEQQKKLMETMITPTPTPGWMSGQRKLTDDFGQSVITVTAANERFVDSFKPEVLINEYENLKKLWMETITLTDSKKVFTQQAELELMFWSDRKEELEKQLVAGRKATDSDAESEDQMKSLEFALAMVKKKMTQVADASRNETYSMAGVTDQTADWAKMVQRTTGAMIGQEVMTKKVAAAIVTAGFDTTKLTAEQQKQYESLLSTVRGGDMLAKEIMGIRQEQEGLTGKTAKLNTTFDKWANKIGSVGMRLGWLSFRMTMIGRMVTTYLMKPIQMVIQTLTQWDKSIEQVGMSLGYLAAFGMDPTGERAAYLEGTMNDLIDVGPRFTAAWGYMQSVLIDLITAVGKPLIDLWYGIGDALRALTPEIVNVLVPALALIVTQILNLLPVLIGVAQTALPAFVAGMYYAVTAMTMLVSVLSPILPLIAGLLGFLFPFAPLLIVVGTGFYFLSTIMSGLGVTMKILNVLLGEHGILLTQTWVATMRASGGFFELIRRKIVDISMSVKEIGVNAALAASLRGVATAAWGVIQAIAPMLIISGILLLAYGALSGSMTADTTSMYNAASDFSTSFGADMGDVLNAVTDTSTELISANEGITYSLNKTTGDVKDETGKIVGHYNDAERAIYFTSGVIAYDVSGIGTQFATTSGDILTAKDSFVDSVGQMKTAVEKLTESAQANADALKQTPEHILATIVATENWEDTVKSLAYAIDQLTYGQRRNLSQAEEAQKQEIAIFERMVEAAYFSAEQINYLSEVLLANNASWLASGKTMLSYMDELLLATDLTEEQRAALVNLRKALLDLCFKHAAPAAAVFADQLHETNSQVDETIAVLSDMKSALMEVAKPTVSVVISTVTKTLIPEITSVQAVESFTRIQEIIRKTIEELTETNIALSGITERSTSAGEAIISIFSKAITILNTFAQTFQTSETAAADLLKTIGVMSVFKTPELDRTLQELAQIQQELVQVQQELTTISTLRLPEFAPIQIATVISTLLDLTPITEQVARLQTFFVELNTVIGYTVNMLIEIRQNAVEAAASLEKLQIPELPIINIEVGKVDFSALIEGETNAVGKLQSALTDFSQYWKYLWIVISSTSSAAVEQINFGWNALQTNLSAGFSTLATFLPFIFTNLSTTIINIWMALLANMQTSLDSVITECTTAFDNLKTVLSEIPTINVIIELQVQTALPDILRQVEETGYDTAVQFYNLNQILIANNASWEQSDQAILSYIDNILTATDLTDDMSTALVNLREALLDLCFKHAAPAAAIFADQLQGVNDQVGETVTGLSDMRSALMSVAGPVVTAAPTANVPAAPTAEVGGPVTQTITIYLPITIGTVSSEFTPEELATVISKQLAEQLRLRGVYLRR
jgi:hypothetical protein